MADFNLSSLDPLKQQATQAQQTADTYSQAAGLLPGMLRDALNKKFSDNNPLIQQRGQALANYMTAAEGAQKEFLPVQQSGLPFSPTQLRALQGQREASALIPLTNINAILSQTAGTIPQIVSDTGAVFTGQVGAAQNTAANSRQNYLDRLDELFKSYQINRQKELDAAAAEQAAAELGFRQQQFEQIDLPKLRYEINKPYYKTTGGGAGSIDDPLGLF